MKKKASKYRLIHFVIIFYLLAAFGWWAILLFKKNAEIYSLRQNLTLYESQLDREHIEAEYRKQQNMIIGETLVFGATILIGMFLVNRAFWSEITANRKLNNFLLSVTHELKTPVAAIKLVHDTLGRKELPTEKQKELIRMAQEEGTRLEALVSNILTVAQLDQSYAFNYESLDLDGIIIKRIQKFERYYPGRNIIYTKKGEGRTEADREAIIKLLDNLLDNAIKYSPAESDVRAELVFTEKNVLIRIMDEGHGIETQEKQKVYEKFYRIGNEETRESKGTGLGLFIVKEIVQGHGGNITIRDNHPTGTIFEITLPKRQL